MQKFRSIPTELCFDELVLEQAINKSNEDAPYVQILRTGKFNHDLYGEFEITSDTLRQLKENFDKKVRGVDLAVDYFHESDKFAAGWFTELFLMENDTQLWGKVRWTSKARTKIAEKEVRYFSADFMVEYTDPETGERFQNVLLGGGLTNRPFIKGMEPIAQLHEKTKGDTSMTLDELKKENDRLNKELSEAKKAAEMMPSKEEKIAALQAEIEAKMKELEALKADNQALKDEKVKYEEEKKLAEKKAAFAKLLTEGKACAAQEEAFIAGDTVKFAELAQPLNLEGKGNGGGTEGEGDEDVAEKVRKLAQEKVKADAKLDIGTAISLVLSENKELAKQYAEKQ